MHFVSPQGSERTSPEHAVRSYRHSICSLAYVRIDHANGGIIRNLSSCGMGIQAVGRLHPEQVVHLRFEFMRPRAKFELVGQVAWANAEGQAGLRFTELPLRSRRLLMDWIFTDLLTAVAEVAAAPVLQDRLNDGLLISKAPVRSFRLTGRKFHAAKELAREVLAEGQRITIPGWPVSIGQRTFARAIDAIMILCAVLLFSIIVAQLIDSFPSGRLLLAIEAGVTGIFAALYRYVCHLLLRDTLGDRLGLLAVGNGQTLDTTAEPTEDDGEDQ